ncbi:MAG: hypothetical protein A2287_03520 [Candidatus Melainabacteria bacterium RIFOXYA12_FULL_32_12]|nr:MAG: hypothetical protein A2104_04275 [Candidatus Melainabacteria bacterium GWF2_32_7]OGI19641.1 MAG: hypothetical protein A2255_08675 [Candidatus Melainabacteria bacterium RIFOXYA2_FULL_32_9]OGI28517.1 MAG: hypothetical protein A2287_03520 [Candidatus Melainabacteria bacterium RIFOXYA12_FULL_32_12]
MNYFRLENNKFKIFIKNSKAGKSQLSESDFDIPEIKELMLKNPVPSYIRKIIRNLDSLTLEDKIIWSQDFEGFFRGLVIKDCRFSNFKIIIENDNSADFDDYGIDKLNNFESAYRISLIKDGLGSKKTEYIINLQADNDEITHLFEAIERKLIQQNN